MRTHSRNLICVFTVLACTSFAGHAEQAEKPKAFAGYQMTFNGRVMGVPCTEWKITEVKADGDVVSTCKSYILESSGKNDYNPVRLSTMHGVKLMEFSPYAPVLKFPLSVGQQWSTPYTAFDANTGLIAEFVANCKVASYEPTTVPAGTLNAFKIDCADKWTLGPQTGIYHTTRWYAPEAAAVVKSDNKEDPARWNFELTSYGLPSAMNGAGAAAPPVAAAPTTDTAPVTAPGSSGNLDQIAPIKEFDQY